MDSKAALNEEEVPQPTPTMTEDLRSAFALGKKLTVTPRGGEPTDIVIRPFYVDQALDLIDDIEKIYRLINTKADDKGNVDLFEVFKAARDEVMNILCKLIERDRAFVGKMELDDLVEVFAEIFNQNKDFFDKRVKGTLGPLFGQISSML